MRYIHFPAIFIRMIQSLDLAGTWKLRWHDGARGKVEPAIQPQFDADRYIDAAVPGEVHLDLLAAGIIDDPYTGMGALKSRWVEESIFAYRTTFDADASAVSAPHAWLVFDGLDLAACVYLNGIEVGRHCNAFRPCRIGVAGKLLAKDNVLAVIIEGGLFYAKEKPGEGYVHFQGHPLAKRQWLRKPQFQFGWDWATRLTNVGIFAPVRLEWTTNPLRVDQITPLVSVSPDLSEGVVRVRVAIENCGDAPLPITLEATVAGALGSATNKEVPPGKSIIECTLRVPHPKLWWPREQGDQALHHLRVHVRSGNEMLEEKTVLIGFRRVRVIQDAHPASGKYFYFEINNRRVFMKGGNWIPCDMITARATDRQTLSRWIALAAAQHFNFLRINAVGMYESDTFYELCDQAGIMVWQEFTFSNSKYPIHDEAFYHELKIEIAYNIRRLAGHASLIAWCGNNEQEWDVWEKGRGAERGIVLADYGLYHHAIPRLLCEEDPDRYYQPSSPFSPDRLPPNQSDVGNQHSWAVSFGTTDFREYRVMTDRFGMEAGILGPTSLATLLACLPPDQRRWNSPSWVAHDNTLGQSEDAPMCDTILQQWLGMDIRRLSLEDYCYWGGLLQGEALRDYFESFRRRMFDCGGAVFWMFNDCWPAVRSWTTVDYYLRNTPSFHPVRRALAPVHLALVHDESRVRIIGINDTPSAVNGMLRFGIFNFDGKYDVDQQINVELKPGAACEIASFDSSQWKSPDQSAAFATLSSGDQPLARNRLILPMYKEMRWPVTDVRIEMRRGRAVFHSDTFAWNICLDLNGDLDLADNFFDVYPGQPYTIDWSHEKPPTIVRIGNAIQSR